MTSLITILGLNQDLKPDFMRNGLITILKFNSMDLWLNKLFFMPLKFVNY